jgi:hypothetical protein
MEKKRAKLERKIKPNVSPFIKELSLHSIMCMDKSFIAPTCLIDSQDTKGQKERRFSSDKVSQVNQMAWTCFGLHICSVSKPKIRLKALK